MSTLETKYNALTNDFKKELQNIITLADNAVCIINVTSIKIALQDAIDAQKIVFASDVELNVKSQKLNFPNSGSFNPDNKGNFWRTIHAANILQNWEAVLELSKKYCEKHTHLLESAFE